MGLELTDSRNREFAIESTNECICVEAGAGTGKTTLLVERLLNHIKEGASLRRIAAITFTEKAAGELRLRLYEGLEKKLSESEDETEREKIRKELSYLEVAQISTIHSFAATLLRIRPIEAKVDPGFEVMDEETADLLAAEVWDRWLVENMSKDDWLLEILVSLGVRPKDLGQLARSFYKNREAVEILTHPDNYIEETRDKLSSLIDKKRAEIECKIIEIEESTRKVLGIGMSEPRSTIIKTLRDNEDKTSQQIKALLQMWDDFEASEKDSDFIHFLYQFSKYSKGSSVKKTNKSDFAPFLTAAGKRTLKELIKFVKEFIKDSINEIGRTICPFIVKKIRNYLDMVEEKKRKQGVLDFHDLLLKARDLLRDNKEVRAFFQNQYDHILVDEFQDTDPLQAEIIFFLCEDGAKAEAWDEVRLKPGKLFIVGDPKQSIYRFRRADFEVFNKAKEIIGKSRTTPIVQNFRSVKNIIGWVNEVFEKVIEYEEYKGSCIQSKYEPIVCSRNENDVPVTIYECEVNSTADEAREVEAEFLAQKIKELVESKEQMRRRDGSVKTISYGDICVLFRKLTVVGVYENALKKYGIPYRTEGGKSFFSKQEIFDLRNALRAIDSPYDEVAVIGALRSPFFAITDEELADHKINNGRFNYYTKEEIGNPKVLEALKALSEFHNMRHKKTLSQLIGDLLEKTKILEAHALFDSSLQSCTNFLRLVEMLREMSQRDGVEFSNALRWITLMTDRDVRMGEAPAEEGGTEFVQLISVHKAKGLEFPIVFAAGLGGKGPSEQTRLIIRHSQNKAAFKIRDIQSDGYDELADWDKLSQDAEEKRLCYVCATRPMERLILLNFSAKQSKLWFTNTLEKKNKKSKGKGIKKDLSIPTENEYSQTISVSIPEAAKGMEREKPPGEELGDITIDEIESAWADRLNAALDSGGKTVAFESATEHEEILSKAGRPFWSGVGEEVAKALGNAFHELMERMPFDADSVTFRQMAEALARKHGVLEHLDKLEHLCVNVVSSDIWERAKKAPRAFREMPFAVRRNGSVMTGYIDLLIEEDDGLVVVDYKSDNVRRDDVGLRLGFYKEQGEFYREAITRAGFQVKDVIFFFAAPGVSASLKAYSKF